MPEVDEFGNEAFATPLGSVGLDQLLGRGIVARVGLAFVPLQKGLSRQFSKPYFPGWARLRGHYFERPITYVDIQHVTAYSLRRRIGHGAFEGWISKNTVKRWLRYGD